MSEPSWRPDGTPPAILEENWLFRLARERFRSTASDKVHDYYVVHLVDAVNVVALTPTNRLILVRQFRAGSGRDSLETPGGLVDEGEDPLEAAARELREETGYAGDPPRVLGVAWSNPSILTSRSITVLITNAVPVARPSLDASEELHVELVPAGQVPWMIRDGRIDHALVVQGLLLWLASELPESPLALPKSGARGLQFHVRSLMIATAACAGIFALTDALSPSALLRLVWGVAFAFGPILALRYLDPPRRAVLLRGERISLRRLTVRLLAALGLSTLLWVAGVYLVHRFG
jgi:8-oxo-dGTP pyrophosphatase MutT (NUDIX family)